VDRIAAVRFWNYTAGHNDDHNFYISDLAVTSANPFLDPELVRSLAVIREEEEGETAYCTAVAARIDHDPETGQPMLVVTLDGDAPGDLSDFVWQASELDGDSRQWIWSHVPASEVSISGNTVTISCSDRPFSIYCFGRPGGMDGDFVAP